MNTREFLNILHVAERLKDTTRHCTTSKRRVESVAEHSWRVSLMATLLRYLGLPFGAAGRDGLQQGQAARPSRRQQRECVLLYRLRCGQRL